MSEADRLAEIKARRAAVKGLPWELDGDEIVDPDGQVVADVVGRTNPEFIANAPADIDWLVGEVERLDNLTLVAQRDIDRLRGLLARLEWVGVDTEGMPPGGAVVFRSCCPACDAYEGDPHEPDCWLAAELR